jgi:diaminopimelate epimerase
MTGLSKLHGLGNDFLVALVDPPAPDPAVAAALCARRTGVGADGLIYGLVPSVDDADVRMVLLNADGSEAEISGNGIRCLAQEFLRVAGRGEGTVRIETAVGVRTVRTVRGDPAGELVSEVDFGIARPGPGVLRSADAVPARHRASVDVGNPHVVLVTDRVDDLDVAVVGPQVEAAYPAGVNVHLATVGPEDAVALRVWERGVGVTEACGSGAVATAWALHELGLVGSHVAVDMPGGSVEVVVGDDGRLSLVGPSVFVGSVEPAEGLWP